MVPVNGQLKGSRTTVRADEARSLAFSRRFTSTNAANDGDTYSPYFRCRKPSASSVHVLERNIQPAGRRGLYMCAELSRYGLVRMNSMISMASNTVQFISL